MATRHASEFVIPQPQPHGPPDLLENPQVVAGTAANVHTGSALASSGILLPPEVPGNPLTG
jgi:hypothetical protein